MAGKYGYHLDQHRRGAAFNNWLFKEERQDSMVRLYFRKQQTMRQTLN